MLNLYVYRQLVYTLYLYILKIHFNLLTIESCFLKPRKFNTTNYSNYQ